MADPRRIAALSVAASLALPAGAFAQGAGETQYGDPFEGEQRAQAQPGSGSGSGNGTGEELSTSPPGTSESAAAQTRTPAGELARTGSEPGLVALLGLGFLMTGAGLRVRVRRPIA
ncbi:MAG TPA: hypothetical protein VNB64_10820 [Solirubrobacteraceae bacterium]|nr:hypothetical protein [Solirubrobacteraceae bacterium]